MKASVLLTNNWFGGRSGTEVVTRDFARGLATRGWRVGIYALEIGNLWSEVGPTVAVVPDLDALGWVPDLIHGNQPPSLIPALLRFPNVPAIQFRHDAKYLYDQSLKLDRIRLHVAVDRACREAVSRDTGLNESEIRILANAIDLEVCRQRPPLPVRPRKVLTVANRNADHVSNVVTACERLNLDVTVVGKGVGQPSFNLEAEMASADMVVGAARIALEAMAVGCASLVCDGRGFAGLVTQANFDEWRAWNFGHRLLTSATSPDLVAQAFMSFDSVDAARVSERVRAEASLKSALDQLEEIYRGVLRTPGPETDGSRDARELGIYFTRLHAHGYKTEQRLDALIADLKRKGLTVTFSD